MALWIIIPALTLLAIGFVVVPLLRGRSRNTVSTIATIEGSKSPIQRNVVWLGLGLAAIVAVPAIALYASVGRPDLATVERHVADVTQSAAGDAESPAQSMAGMIAQLQDKTRQNPTDADAWQTLGWAYMHLRKPTDAVTAYRKALSLKPNSAETRSALAEATIQSGSGKISPDTYSDLQKVAAADRGDARARFYLALYKDQQGDHRGAIADWITLLKSASADAAWAPQVRRVITEVAKEQNIDVSGDLPAETAQAGPTQQDAPGPSQAQMAAAQQMSSTDRSAMIQGMVERLASELKQNPKNADGWLRLIRARMVLGEKPQAVAALHDAQKAFAGDASQLSAINDAARNLGVEG